MCKGTLPQGASKCSVPVLPQAAVPGLSLAMGSTSVRSPATSSSSKGFLGRTLCKLCTPYTDAAACLVCSADCKILKIVAGAPVLARLFDLIFISPLAGGSVPVPPAINTPSNSTAPTCPASYRAVAALIEFGSYDRRTC